LEELSKVLRDLSNRQAAPLQAKIDEIKLNELLPDDEIRRKIKKEEELEEDQFLDNIFANARPAEPQGQIEESKVMDNQNNEQKLRKAWIKLIEKEIREKAVSLDYFWRNIMHMMRTDHEEYTKNAGKTCEHIKDMMVAGMPFELIDGDNLDFKGDLF
jgi:hypothetical protein